MQSSRICCIILNQKYVYVWDIVLTSKRLKKSVSYGLKTFNWKYLPSQSLSQKQMKCPQ